MSLRELRLVTLELKSHKLWRNLKSQESKVVVEEVLKVLKSNTSIQTTRFLKPQMVNLKLSVTSKGNVVVEQAKQLKTKVVKKLASHPISSDLLMNSSRCFVSSRRKDSLTRANFSPRSRL